MIPRTDSILFPHGGRAIFPQSPKSFRKIFFAPGRERGGQKPFQVDGNPRTATQMPGQGLTRAFLALALRAASPSNSAFLRNCDKALVGRGGCAPLSPDGFDKIGFANGPRRPEAVQCSLTKLLRTFYSTPKFLGTVSRLAALSGLSQTSRKQSALARTLAQREHGRPKGRAFSVHADRPEIIPRRSGVRL